MSQVAQGAWSGTWRSTANPGFQGTITLDLSQQAVTVLGASHFFNSPCISEFSDGEVDAQFDEAQRKIAGSIDFPGLGTTVSFTATISGNSARVSGSYSVVGGGCSGDSGTLVADKAAPLVVDLTSRVFLFKEDVLVEEWTIEDSR